MNTRKAIFWVKFYKKHVFYSSSICCGPIFELQLTAPPPDQALISRFKVSLL